MEFAASEPSVEKVTRRRFGILSVVDVFGIPAVLSGICGAKGCAVDPFEVVGG